MILKKATNQISKSNIWKTAEIFENCKATIGHIGKFKVKVGVFPTFGLLLLQCFAKIYVWFNWILFIYSVFLLYNRYSLQY